MHSDFLPWLMVNVLPAQTRAPQASVSSFRDGANRTADVAEAEVHAARTQGDVEQDVEDNEDVFHLSAFRSRISSGFMAKYS
jgi:hypothetical protein